MNERVEGEGRYSGLFDYIHSRHRLCLWDKHRCGHSSDGVGFDALAWLKFSFCIETLYCR